MNKQLYSWISIFFLVMLISCKKDNITPASVASFAVINAIYNTGPVKADFTGKENIFATTQVETDYDAFKRFVVPAGELVPVKVVSSFNTDKVFYRQSFTFQPGDVYSLFLAGEPEAVDTILIKENIPARPDGMMGIRFINFSPSGPIKIVPLHLDANGVPTEHAAIPSLAYKEKTEFISYPAEGNFIFYRIELRDPATDILLGTTTVSASTPFTTVIIRGYIDGDPAFGALRLLHAR